MFKTYGFDLKNIVDEAKRNGNTQFAELVEKQIANVQACYDVIAQKWTATGGNTPWNIDAEYLKGMLK